MSRVRDIANILSGVSTDMATDAEVSSSIASHAAAADPHTGYLKESEFWAAGKNKIINGNFDIWQRGTSSAAAANGTYLADRWRIYSSGTSLNITYSRDTSVPNGNSVYSAKLQQLSNNATSVTEFALGQLMEVATAANFAGRTVIASFWYRSNRTGTHSARLYAVNSTGGTDVTNTFTVNSANTWEYKTISFSSYSSVTAFTGALTDNGGGFHVGINVYPNASVTVSTNDYFQVSQVQLEAGSVATAFQTATGTLQGELAACQRYYAKSYNVETAPASTTTVGITRGYFYASVTGSNTAHYVPFKATMRTSPTITLYDGAGNISRSTVWNAGNTQTNNINSGSLGAQQIGANSFALNEANIGAYWSYGCHYVAEAEL